MVSVDRRPNSRGERPVDAAVAAAPLTGRLDLPAPRCVTEEPSEHGRTVEAGKAQPLHRTGCGHQGARVAVRSQRVIGDSRLEQGELLTGLLLCRLASGARVTRRRRRDVGETQGSNTPDEGAHNESRRRGHRSRPGG